MLDFSIQLAMRAGTFLREKLTSDRQVEYKGIINPVTDADEGSQKLILQAIEDRFPQHSILAEENASIDKNSEFTWIIDPLDGTVNYMHQIPIFCVSIALYRNMTPYLGVCYNPMSNDLFYCEKGKGAYRNGSAIHVSSTERLIETLVVTGFPYTKEESEKVVSRLARVLTEVQGIRRLGSAALDLCFVAAGLFDGYWEIGLSPWDIAAGALMVQEAGGRVTSFDGEALDIFKDDLLAGNPNIHGLLKRLV